LGRADSRRGTVLLREEPSLSAENRLRICLVLHASCSPTNQYYIGRSFGIGYFEIYQPNVGFQRKKRYNICKFYVFTNFPEGLGKERFSFSIMPERFMILKQTVSTGTINQMMEMSNERTGCTEGFHLPDNRGDD
jgi:hypothetical protein